MKSIEPKSKKQAKPTKVRANNTERNKLTREKRAKRHALVNLGKGHKRKHGPSNQRRLAARAAKRNEYLA